MADPGEMKYVHEYDYSLKNVQRGGNKWGWGRTEGRDFPTIKGKGMLHLESEEKRRRDEGQRAHSFLKTGSASME